MKIVVIGRFPVNYIAAVYIGVDREGYGGLRPWLLKLGSRLSLANHVLEI